MYIYIYVYHTTIAPTVLVHEVIQDFYLQQFLPIAIEIARPAPRDKHPLHKTRPPPSATCAAINRELTEMTSVLAVVAPPLREEAAPPSRSKRAGGQRQDCGNLLTLQCNSNIFLVVRTLLFQPTSERVSPHAYPCCGVLCEHAGTR